MLRISAGRSALWSGLESVGLASISAATLVVYSHWLSVSDFGLFATLLALVEALSAIVSLWLHDALVQKRDIGDDHFNAAFTATMTASIAIAASCALLSDNLALKLGVPDEGLTLALLSLCIPAAGLSATIVARQKRDLAFRPLALRSVVGRILGAVVGLTMVFLGCGLWALVVQQLVSSLGATAALWFFSDLRPRLTWQLRPLQELLSFSLFTIAAQVASVSIKRLFTFMVGLSVGVEQAGYLNLSFRCIDVLWAIILTAAAQVALPVFSSITDRQRLGHVYKEISTITGLLVIPVFLSIGIVSEDFVTTLFGDKWATCAPYVTALCVLVCFQSSKLYYSTILISRGSPARVLPGMIIEAVVLTGFFLLLGIASVWAAIIAWILREIASTPISSFLVKTASGISIKHQFKPSFKPSLIGAAIAACLFIEGKTFLAGLPHITRLVVCIVSAVILLVIFTLSFERELFLQHVRTARQILLPRIQIS